MQLLALLWLAGCSVAWGATEAGAPVPMWGEVTGEAPAALTAELRTERGDLAANPNATLTRDAGRLYYSVAWPGGAIRRAVGSGQRLTLGFVADGKPFRSPLQLPAGRSLPELVHVTAAGAVLPAARLLVARAELREDGEIRFTARIATHGDQAVSGSIQWSPRDGKVAGPGSPLELKAGSVTSSNLTWRAPELAALAPIWTVTWEASDPLLPRLSERVRVVRNRRVLEGGGSGEGRLIAGGSMAKRAGLPALSDEELPLASGQYLEVDLEYSGEAADDVTRALGQLSVVDGRHKPGRSSGFALSEARVQPVPGGGLWIHASWIVSRDRVLQGLKLFSTSRSELPGTWKLHFLGSHELFTPARNY